jgi:hypothetical protein
LVSRATGGSFSFITGVNLYKRVKPFLLYSNIWLNTPINALGFQSPTTLLGFLPGIEYFFNDKWACSAGCAVDAVGKFGYQTVTPAFTVYYNF